MAGWAGEARAAGQTSPAAAGSTPVEQIKALEERADAQAVAALIALTKDKDIPTAEAALLALGKIADENACRAIAEALKNGKPELAQAAVEASLTAAEKLAANGQNTRAVQIYESLLEPRQPDNVRRGALGALFRLDRDGGEARILQILDGKDALLKPVAIAAIADLRSAAASERFTREFPNLSSTEQVWMIDALATRGDAVARKTIEGALSSADAEVRVVAITALAKLGNPASAAPLVRALATAQNSLEEALLIKALTSLSGGRETDQALVAALKTENSALRRGLIKVLANRESASAWPAVLAQTRDEETAAAAFAALGALAKPPQVPELLDALVQLKVPSARSDAEDAISKALQKLTPAARSDLVCGALAKSLDLQTRCSLLRLLPICGGPKALAIVTAAQSDTLPQIRDTAVRALADWPDQAAWEPLATIYSSSANAVHRSLALEALVRLAQAEDAGSNSTTLGRYRTLLEHAQGDQDRKLILAAVSESQDPNALDLVIPLLRDQNVRPEAEAALKAIAENVRKQYPDRAQAALKALNH